MEFDAIINTVYSIDNFTYISAHQICTSGADIVQVYVSNDGENFVLYNTLTGPSIISISGGFSKIRFIRIAGSSNIKVSCNRRYPV